MSGPTTGTPALAAALAKVQAELPKLERDRTVEVETKKGPYTYSYVTLATLSAAVLPLLAKQGLSFTAMPGAGSDGKMCVRYSLMHSSGEALTGEFPISGEGGIQMIGGRITYARRYCLAAVVGIAADEDDDAQLSDGPARPAQRRQAPATRKQDGPATTRAAPTRPRETARPQSRPPLPGEETGAAEPITKPQLTKLHTVFTAIGENDRDERLRTSSIIVGRHVASSTDLTKAEASTLIDQLEKVASQKDPADQLADLLDFIREAARADAAKTSMPAPADATARADQGPTT